jgi:anti-sigma factor RsiW
MAGLLEQLRDDQAVLLMYVADELTEDDRAAVEQRLAGDAALRQKLAELRGLNEQMGPMIAGLYEADRASGDALARRMWRAVNRRQMELLATAPVPAPLRSAKWSWWKYVVTTAAVVLIGLLGLWGLMPMSPTVTPSPIAGPIVENPQPDETATHDQVAMTLVAASTDEVAVNDEPLFAAERHLQELATLVQ